MGHIRKIKKGRWQARYIDPTGRERAKDFSREAEAKNFLSVIQGQMQTGDWIDPRLARTAFEDYAAQWLDTKHGVNARTLINIEGRVRNHLLPAFGARPLVSIRPSDVRAWVKNLSASGLSPSTVKACYLTFNQIMRTAVIDRLISVSPCIGIELPPQSSTEEMHFLDPEEVMRLAVNGH